VVEGERRVTKEEMCGEIEVPPVAESYAHKDATRRGGQSVVYY